MKQKIHPAVAAVAIPALIGLVLTARLVFSSEQKRAADLMQAYTESIARGVSAFFADAATIASVAATLNSVQELDWDRASRDLMALISAAHHVNRISMVDSKGYIHDVYSTGPVGNRWQGGRRTVDNSDPDAEPVNVSGHPHFQELVAQNGRGSFYTVTSESYIPNALYPKAFVTSAPIIKEGRPVGMIVVAQTYMELSLLYEDLSMDFIDKFGNAAHLFLASRNGNLVSNLRYNKAYGAYMDELFGSAEIVPIFGLGDDTAAAILKAIEDEKSAVEADFYGDRHFLAGVKIGNTPFAVCLAVQKSQMLSASRHILLVGGISFALTAICVALAFFGISRRMGEPPEEKKKPRRPRRKGRPVRAWRHADFGSDFTPPVMPPEN